MVFNSYVFFIFFALVWSWHQLPLPQSVRKFSLVIASCLFYSAWNPPFVLLLMGVALIDYFLARQMDSLENAILRRMLLVTSLVINLALLSYFKYGELVLESFRNLVQTFGIIYTPPKMNVVLPLGISFYTFETISYLIDVYKRRIAATRSFLDYALFLTFFPHLVAGPIVRAHDFFPQCSGPMRATRAQVQWGMSLVIIGLFQKVVLADGMLSQIVDKTYNAADVATFGDAWVGTFAFASQIFFDFAGYSTCGIGVALTLGFVLTDNFHYPYAAIGFSDFWRRWHISLSSWLRDYLYISLGGSRVGPLRTYANLMITMLLGGLWHGASWRFVVWGGLHGLYLIIERFIVTNRPNNRKEIESRSWQGISLIILTYLAVCITWVFFRANSFNDASLLLADMFRPSLRLELLSKTEVMIAFGISLSLLAWHIWVRDSSIEAVADRAPRAVRSVALAGMLVAIAFNPGDDRAFIYFQF